MSLHRRASAPPPIDQRSAILAQAAGLFASKGFPSASMNDVADAAGLSKATLYHYFTDKGEILKTIADAHVSRLVEVVRDIEALPHAPGDRLELLIAGFMSEYESAQQAHRVLTEDVRFLEPAAREQILSKERRVVQAFADALAEVRPELKKAKVDKALTMLLFGMINWMFTWLDANGRLSYEDMAKMVTGLFFRGVLDMPIAVPARRKRPNRGVSRVAN